MAPTGWPSHLDKHPLRLQWRHSGEEIRPRPLALPAEKSARQPRHVQRISIDAFVCVDPLRPNRPHLRDLLRCHATERFCRQAGACGKQAGEAWHGLSNGVVSGQKCVLVRPSGFRKASGEENNNGGDKRTLLENPDTGTLGQMLKRAAASRCRADERRHPAPPASLGKTCTEIPKTTSEELLACRGNGETSRIECQARRARPQMIPGDPTTAPHLAGLSINIQMQGAIPRRTPTSLAGYDPTQLGPSLLSRQPLQRDQRSDV